MVASETGLAHPQCYARQLHDCCHESSREHYMTEAVLQGIAGGKRVGVRGLAWQKGGASQYIATKGLTGWILCKRHNNALSDLDHEAKRLIDSLKAIHDGFNDGQEVRHDLDGDKLERWMLKTLCGHLASGSMADQEGRRIEDWTPPLEWLEIIFRRCPFPLRWGMYCSYAGAEKQQEMSLHPLCVTPIRGSDNSIWGMRLGLFENEFILSMHEMVKHSSERLLDNAEYRPGGFLFQDPNCRKWLVFKWKERRLLRPAIPIQRVQLPPSEVPVS